MNALDLAGIVPDRLPIAPRQSVRRRLVSGGFHFAVSLALNVLVVGAVWRLAFNEVGPLRTPDAIPVDLVQEPSPSASRPVRDAEPATERVAAPQVENANVASPATTPATGGLSRPEADPETPQKSHVDASEPRLKAPNEVERHDEPTVAHTASAGPPVAAPAPLEGATTMSAPHLVEAPPDPRQAAQQATHNVLANALPEKSASTDPVQQLPAPTPQVLTAPNDDEVPLPSTLPDKAPPTAEEQRQAENTAKLAAALPFATSMVPDTLRRAASGNGSAEAQAYRGAVYGTFHRAEAVVAAAQAKHLRGQAVIAFSIDDAGALTAIRVALSSGDDQVDAAALEYIRKAAPYPPPPPGAPRDFSPAIGFGLDPQ